MWSVSQVAAHANNEALLRGGGQLLANTSATTSSNLFTLESKGGLPGIEQHRSNKLYPSLRSHIPFCGLLQFVSSALHSCQL